MIRFALFLIFSFFLTANLGAQKTSDSLRNLAKSLLYEQPDETIKISLKLLKQEKKVDEAAHLYMLISNAYIAKRNTDSSLYYILKAADLIKTETLPSTKIKILNSVAVQYQQMELYDKALETLDQSLALTEKLPAGDKDQIFNMGFINAVRGMIYRSQSNPDLALEKFKLAAQNFHLVKQGKMNSANLSIIYYNIGNCFIDLSKFAEAMSNFKKSEGYAKISEAASLEAYALKGQGESLFLTHQYHDALSVLYRAEKLAETSGDLVLNEGIYRLLANSNLVINEFSEFQKYNNKLLEVQKTLEQNELKSLNRYLNTQNLEAQETNNEIERKYRMYNWIIIASVLIIVLLLLKKLMDVRKINRRQKNIIETVTQTDKDRLKPTI